MSQTETKTRGDIALDVLVAARHVQDAIGGLVSALEAAKADRWHMFTGDLGYFIDRLDNDDSELGDLGAEIEKLAFLMARRGAAAVLSGLARASGVS